MASFPLHITFKSPIHTFFYEKVAKLRYFNQIEIRIVFVLGVNVDGNATMGENIADHGGLKIAEIAYENWLRRNNGHDTLLPALQVPTFKSLVNL